MMQQTLFPFSPVQITSNASIRINPPALRSTARPHIQTHFSSLLPASEMLVLIINCLCFLFSVSVNVFAVDTFS